MADEGTNRRNFLRMLGMGAGAAILGESAQAQPADLSPDTIFPVDSPDHLQLKLGENYITINDFSAATFEINKALLNPTQFKRFVVDPESFSAQYGLEIDPLLADVLKERLDGVGTIEDARNLGNTCLTCATIWAVAEGSYSVASSKIAVAY